MLVKKCNTILCAKFNLRRVNMKNKKVRKIKKLIFVKMLRNPIHIYIAIYKVMIKLQRAYRGCLGTRRR